MRISDWSSDVCSSDLSVVFRDAVTLRGAPAGNGRAGLQRTRRHGCRRSRARGHDRRAARRHARWLDPPPAPAHVAGDDPVELHARRHPGPADQGRLPCRGPLVIRPAPAERHRTRPPPPPPPHHTRTAPRPTPPPLPPLSSLPPPPP